MFSFLTNFLSGKKTKIAAFAMVAHGLMGLMMNVVDATSQFAMPMNEAVNNIVDGLAVWGFRSAFSNYIKKSVNK